MPDISMCAGDGCSKKITCYRYRAVPSGLQSYFATPPIRPDGTCDYFNKIWKGDALSDGSTVDQEGKP